MGVPKDPGPVMLFAGMLSGDPGLMDDVEKNLAEKYGGIHYRSEDLPWNYTTYYRKELGEGIRRRFIFFRDLIVPDEIVGIKLETNRIEGRYLRDEGGEPLRRINLDPGYLDPAKVVLVSTKDFSHRIYLGSGIYGELTLTNIGGVFRPLPYTYPDYRAEETLRIFNSIRGDSVLLRRRSRTSA
ncbi:MAG: DUF4416 family protein [Deltaproteobacteria bacterium]|nr:DUF4416 family protein [Deltaproteobacteria bacterium]